MCVWLANLQSKIQKPFLELVGQPRARSEATNEERKLFPNRQKQSLISVKYTNRTDGKLFTEIISDSDHGGLDGGFETLRNFRTVCVR